MRRYEQQWLKNSGRIDGGAPRSRGSSAKHPTISCPATSAVKAVNLDLAAVKSADLEYKRERCDTWTVHFDGDENRFNVKSKCCTRADRPSIERIILVRTLSTFASWGITAASNNKY